MKTKIHTLDNGLKTLLIDTEAFPSLTTLLLVGAGSRYENKKNNGIAHFFEHMAFKGSKKYPNAFVLASIVDGLGGAFNAFTGKDYTGYYIKSPTKHAETTIDVIGDMIQSPFLREEEIEREKGVIVQEINMYEDTPQRRVFELYETLLYNDTPLGYDITGTEKTVTSFNRETFTQYMDSLYHPNNAVLILAGGLSNGSKHGTKDYIEMVEERFSPWKKGKASTFDKVKDEQTEPKMLLKYKKSEQAHLCLGYRAFSRHEDKRYILSVLSSILGKGMSSRLFTEVREKRGLCYSIGMYNELYDDVGNVLVYAGVSTDVEKVKETIKVVLDELNKVVEKGVTEEELARAKELLKGRLILSMEDTFNVANTFGNQMLHDGELRTVEKITKKIEAVTLANVKDMAKEIFNRNHLNLALIGPFKNEDTFRKLL